MNDILIFCNDDYIQNFSRFWTCLSPEFVRDINYEVFTIYVMNFCIPSRYAAVIFAVIFCIWYYYFSNIMIIKFHNAFSI